MRRPMMRRRVFIIGFNKCGTRSLVAFFEENGLRGLHVGVAWAEFARTVEANIAAGRPMLDPYDYDVFADSPLLRDFRSLDADYPGSYFVLNTRDVDDWIMSRLNHLDGRYVEWLNRRRAEPRTRGEWMIEWRAAWDAHHHDVRSHFAGRPDDLLVFDIARDPVDGLVAFLRPTYALDPGTWRHEGKTTNPAYIRDQLGPPGLVEVHTDEQGREVYRLTEEGVRVADMADNLDGEDPDAVLEELLRERDPLEPFPSAAERASDRPG